MAFSSAMAISLGAVADALTRWWLGLVMNSIVPTIRLGTLTVNLAGGFLIGVVMALTKSPILFPETVRLSITTGFLGGLTTFSTFSAETMTLIAHQEYLWTATMIVGHVGGSIAATMCGIFCTNFFIVLKNTNGGRINVHRYL